MDPATASAVAALVIASIALLIAIAQILQQYASSGETIRLCDSIVYGGSSGLPGRGYRVWNWRQFRFRIFYSMPEISLESQSIWTRHNPFSKTRPNSIALSSLDGFRAMAATGWSDFDTTSKKLSSPHVSDAKVSDKGQAYLRGLFEKNRPSPKISPSHYNGRHGVGEASWVSLCRAVYGICGSSVIVTMVDGDADRCSPDFTTIPMPVSMRDIALMALSIGLNCIEADFTRKTISMQGIAGSIHTSQHPMVGPLIRFTPSKIRYGIANKESSMRKDWILRVLGVVIIGRHEYRPDQRRFAERADIQLEAFSFKLRTSNRSTISDEEFYDRRGGYDSYRRDGYDSYRRGGYDSYRRGGYDSYRRGEYDSYRRGGYDSYREIPIRHRQSTTQEELTREREIAESKERLSRLFGGSNDDDHVAEEISERNTYQDVMVKYVHQHYSTTMLQSDGLETPPQGKPVGFPAFEERRSVRFLPEPGFVIPYSDSEDSITNNNSSAASDTSIEERMSAGSRKESEIRHFASRRAEQKQEEETVATKDIENPAQRNATVPLKRSSEDGAWILSFEKEKNAYTTGKEPGVPENNDQGSLSDYTKTPAQAISGIVHAAEQHDKDIIERENDKSHVETRSASISRHASLESDQRLYSADINLGPDFPDIESMPCEEGTAQSDVDEESISWYHEFSSYDEHVRPRKNDSDLDESDAGVSEESSIYTSTDIEWYWLCQMNVFLGLWATPWQHRGHAPTYLDVMVITLALLEKRTTSLTLLRCNDFGIDSSWVLSGDLFTYPPHARHTRMGRIPSGKYPCIYFDSFNVYMPPIQIRHENFERRNLRVRIERELMDPVSWTTELMALDAWLSFAGRTNAIQHGPNKLLNATPALVAVLADYIYAECSECRKVGQQLSPNDIEKDLEESAIDLSDAEMLYLLVAMLRTVKIAICVGFGSSTVMLQEILRKDVQAYLV